MEHSDNSHRSETLIKDIVDFIESNKIDINDIDKYSKTYYQDKFEDLNKQTKDNIADTLKSNTTNDNSLFIKDIASHITDTNKLLVMINLFKRNLILELIPEDNIDYKKIGKLERQISPPLEAYKTDRNNIGYSNISHGLLFE